MKRFRTYATVLSLAALVGLPVWSVGCGGQTADNGNGGAAGESSGGGTTTPAPESGSTVGGGGVDVPGVSDEGKDGSSNAPADESPKAPANDSAAPSSDQ